MTPTAFALAAISYIEAAGTEPTLAASTTAQKTRIATDLTATLKEIAILNPGFFRRPVAALLNAPETVTIAVTRGSTAVGSLTLGSASFENGVTIQIAGDATYNELRLEGATYILRLPYAGTTGTQTATLYHDSVPLPSSAREVAGPVIIPDNVILTKRRNRDDALRATLPCEDYGRPARSVATRRDSGRPAWYWVESFYGTDATINHRLRVLPMPSSALVVEFIANVQPPRYAVADLGSDASPSSTHIPAPDDAAEAIVLPMFLKRWSGSPWMREIDAKTEINAGDKTARFLLSEIHVQRNVNGTITAPL